MSREADQTVTDKGLRYVFPLIKSSIVQVCEGKIAQLSLEVSTEYRASCFAVVPHARVFRGYMRLPDVRATWMAFRLTCRLFVSSGHSSGQTYARSLGARQLGQLILYSTKLRFLRTFTVSEHYALWFNLQVA